MTFPTNVRPAIAADIVEGAKIWYRDLDDGEGCLVVDEVLNPASEFKAYLSDGCKYGLDGAFVEVNRFVYHYNASYQLEYGTVNYIDGIVQLKKRITEMVIYSELKKEIEPENYERLTINSLSFLGMEY